MEKDLLKMDKTAEENFQQLKIGDLVIYAEGFIDGKSFGVVSSKKNYSNGDIKIWAVPVIYKGGKVKIDPTSSENEEIQFQEEIQFIKKLGGDWRKKITIT